MDSKYLVNPFSRIAGFPALLTGLILVTLLSYICYVTGTHFYDLTDIQFAKDTNFIFYFLEHIISWVIISVVMLLMAVFLSKSKIRLIDFFGTTILARFPLLIVPTLRFIPYFKSFVSESPAMYIIYGIHILCLIWTIVLLYNAYNTSSNLKGNKLTISFIIGMIISEIVTHIIINNFIYNI